MERVNLSDSMDFSRIIQGFWRVCDWGITDKELRGFMEQCMERGVDTFDTADIYGGGECEVQVGRALRTIDRKRYRVVSKTGICLNQNGNYYDTSYDHIVTCCRQTIEKLHCQYLDLYLIHREDPMLDAEEVSRAFETLKKDGLILEAGVSNFDPFKLDMLNNAMRGTLRTNQIEWNPCCFEHFETGMMDMLQRLHMHPMIWSPLCGGRLFNGNEPIYRQTRENLVPIADRYGIGLSTLVYAWILKHPVVAMPLVGSGNIARLDDAVKALEVKLSREDWFRVYAASGQRTIR